MSDDYTLLVAVAAGVISFVSPCVLPLVPAYLGQLSAVAVAARQRDGVVGGKPSRWAAVRHAIAYVAGFGLVFTLLGITAAFAGGAIADLIKPLRIIGGFLLVVMGMSLAGLIHIPILERTWRPLDAGASASVTAATGGMSLAPAGAGLGGRLGARLVGERAGLATSVALGAVFAIGWTPCIGAFLGAVLAMAAGQSDKGGPLQGAILLLGYTAGLGIPFIVLAFFYDRAGALMRPLVRHGRAVSLVGGLLVAAIGLAMVFDLLVLLPKYFQFGGI
jgi:cytochrome c-type biogenesis protein